MEKMDAAASLDAVRATQDKLADKMHWPFWRHAITGVFLAVLLIAMALPSWPGLLLTSGTLFAIVFLVEHDKKTTGFFISGYQKGRTGWIIGLLIALMLAAVIVTLVYLDDPLRDPRFWAMEGGLLVGSTALSYLWAKIYRDDLRSGRA